MEKEAYCRWVFRPGIGNLTHFARADCDHDYKALTKCSNVEPKPGCADCYNGRLCPVCKRPIKIDYWLVDIDDSREECIDDSRVE